MGTGLIPGARGIGIGTLLEPPERMPLDSRRCGNRQQYAPSSLAATELRSPPVRFPAAFNLLISYDIRANCCERRRGGTHMRPHLLLEA